MYPQAVYTTDSLQMLGDTLRFEGIPAEAINDSLIGLKHYLFIVFVLMVGSYLFGSRKRQLGIYLKMFLMPHKELSYDFDMPINRFQNWFCVFALVVSSLFVSLLFSVENVSKLASITWPLWLMALALTIGFFLLKLLLNRCFSWLHLHPSQGKVMQTRVVAFLNFLSMALLLLMLLNECVALSMQTLWISALAVYLILKLVSLPGLLAFFSSQRLSLFHSFLYLCSLEIVPLLVLGKGIVLMAQLTNL